MFYLAFRYYHKAVKTKGSKQNWIAACCSGIIYIYICAHMFLNVFHLIHAGSLSFSMCFSNMILAMVFFSSTHVFSKKCLNTQDCSKQIAFLLTIFYLFDRTWTLDGQ